MAVIFLVTGASQPTFIEDSIENLVIANVGSPAYTTQLDNVEFRALMTDWLDPQTNTGIPVYGERNLATGRQDDPYPHTAGRRKLLFCLYQQHAGNKPGVGSAADH